MFATRSKIAVSMTIGLLLSMPNSPAIAADPPPPFTFGRPESVATSGMVATSHPQAVRIGVEILKAGGNAVDAAIATNAAMGLMEPMSCGAGGDLFAIVWDAKTQKL